MSLIMVDVMELVPEKVEALAPQLSLSARLEFGGFAIGCFSCSMVEFCTKRISQSVQEQEICVVQINGQFTQEQEPGGGSQTETESIEDRIASDIEVTRLEKTTEYTLEQNKISETPSAVDSQVSTDGSGSQVAEAAKIEIVKEKQPIAKQVEVEVKPTKVEALEAESQTNYLEELMDDSIEIVLADVFRSKPEPSVRIVAAGETSILITDVKTDGSITEVKASHNNNLESPIDQILSDNSEVPVIISVKEMRVVTPKIVSNEAQGFLPIMTVIKKLKPVVANRIIKKEIQTKSPSLVEEINGDVMDVDGDAELRDVDSESQKIAADLIIRVQENQQQIGNIFESNLIQDDESISKLDNGGMSEVLDDNLDVITDNNETELTLPIQEEFDKIFAGIISQNYPNYGDYLTNFVELKTEVDEDLFYDPIVRGKESIDPETGRFIYVNNKIIIKINKIRKMLAFSSILSINLYARIKR